MCKHQQVVVNPLTIPQLGEISSSLDKCPKKNSGLSLNRSRPTELDVTCSYVHNLLHQSIVVICGPYWPHHLSAQHCGAHSPRRPAANACCHCWKYNNMARHKLKPWTSEILETLWSLSIWLHVNEGGWLLQSILPGILWLGRRAPESAALQSDCCKNIRVFARIHVQAWKGSNRPNSTNSAVWQWYNAVFLLNIQRISRGIHCHGLLGRAVTSDGQDALYPLAALLRDANLFGPPKR